MSELIGWARVSTQDQDLSIQKQRLEDAGCTKIFASKHSGKAESNADKLAEMMGYVRSGDVLVVTKLDRLGRSLSQVLQVVDQLNSKGVALEALDQPIDTRKQDAMSKAMMQLLGMFAEMERNMIVERTTQGRIASGRMGGRKPKLSEEQIQDMKNKFKQGVSKVKLAEEFNVSRATVLNHVGKCVEESP